jgi:hypothetical protein
VPLPVSRAFAEPRYVPRDGLGLASARDQDSGFGRSLFRPWAPGPETAFCERPRNGGGVAAPAAPITRDPCPERARIVSPTRPFTYYVSALVRVPRQRTRDKGPRTRSDPFAMLDTLTDKFNETFRNLTGRGRISEENIREAMREVRTSLLEAGRQLQGRPGLHRVGRPEGDRAGGDQDAQARRGDGPDRVRGARQPDGPRGHADLLRPAAADGHHDGRPAGLREDDDLRQAGPDAGVEGATTRCCARPTCSGRRPSSSCGSSGRS